MHEPCYVFERRAFRFTLYYKALNAPELYQGTSSPTESHSLMTCMGSNVHYHQKTESFLLHQCITKRNESCELCLVQTVLLYGWCSSIFKPHFCESGMDRSRMPLTQSGLLLPFITGAENREEQIRSHWVPFMITSETI